MRDSAEQSYWRDCLTEAADECGASLTAEQADYIANSIAGAHECYGMAFGHDVANKNFVAQQQRDEDDLRKALQREREKVTCRVCNGTGVERFQGPYHGSTTRCFKCHGAGRHDP